MLEKFMEQVFNVVLFALALAVGAAIGMMLSH
jgi:hypothetical protein